MWLLLGQHRYIQHICRTAKGEAAFSFGTPTYSRAAGNLLVPSLHFLLQFGSGEWSPVLYYGKTLYYGHGHVVAKSKNWLEPVAMYPSTQWLRLPGFTAAQTVLPSRTAAAR